MESIILSLPNEKQKETKTNPLPAQCTFLIQWHITVGLVKLRNVLIHTRGDWYVLQGWVNHRRAPLIT